MSENMLDTQEGGSPIFFIQFVYSTQFLFSLPTNGYLQFSQTTN